MAIKAREDLRITDNYMFSSVMGNPRLCKGLIEAVLGEPVERVEVHHREHDVRPRISGRGVRFDVYLRDVEGVAYDVEMQETSQDGFERRLGYYRSALDVDAQGRGSDYDAMRGVVVIFFTRFDPFKAGYRRYDCETVVLQTGAALKDGARIVVLNSKGTRGEVDRRVEAFLSYMEDDTMVGDDLVRRIDDEVRLLRANDDWYGEYMRYERYVDEQIAIARKQAIREGLAEGRAAGHAEGLAAGREEGLAAGREEGRAEGLAEGLAEGQHAAETLFQRIANALVAQGRTDELPRMINDPDYRARLIEELGLE